MCQSIKGNFKGDLTQGRTALFEQGLKHLEIVQGLCKTVK